MFGIITKKKLIEVLSNLSDSQDERKATDIKDYYWRCGNANAINYICGKFGIENPHYAERIRGDRRG